MNDRTRAGQQDMDTWLRERQARWTDRPGRTWDDVEPVYRVGWELRGEGRERGWRDVEPEYRRAWTERHPDKPWDRFLDAAQDAWDELTAEPGASPHAGAPGVHDESSRRR